MSDEAALDLPGWDEGDPDEPRERYRRLQAFIFEPENPAVSGEIDALRAELTPLEMVEMLIGFQLFEMAPLVTLYLMLGDDPDPRPWIAAARYFLDRGFMSANAFISFADDVLVNLAPAVDPITGPCEVDARL